MHRPARRTRNAPGCRMFSRNRGLLCPQWYAALNGLSCPHLAERQRLRRGFRGHRTPAPGLSHSPAEPTPAPDPPSSIRVSLCTCCHRTHRRGLVSPPGTPSSTPGRLPSRRGQTFGPHHSLAWTERVSRSRNPVHLCSSSHPRVDAYPHVTTKNHCQRAI